MYIRRFWCDIHLKPSRIYMVRWDFWSNFSKEVFVIAVLLIIAVGYVSISITTLVAMGILMGIIKPFYPLIKDYTESNRFMGGFMIACFATHFLLESVLFWGLIYLGAFEQLQYWHYPILIGASFLAFHNYLPMLIRKLEID